VSIDLIITGIYRPAVPGLAVSVITPLNPLFVIMEEDLENTFFNDQEFAEDANYTHKTGNVTVYKCLYDDPTTNISASSDVEVTLLRPQVMVREKQLQKPVSKGDRLTVRGIRYAVDDYISNGVGILTIFLVKK